MFPWVRESVKCCRAEVVEYSAGIAPQLMGSFVEHVAGGMDSFSIRQPLGVRSALPHPPRSALPCVEVVAQRTDLHCISASVGTSEVICDSSKEGWYKPTNMLAPSQMARM